MGFGALAVATAMNAAPLAVAIPVVVLAAFGLLRLNENSKIKGDAAIALISSGSLAIGVTVISMTTGMNTDVYNYLFGSILSMSREDVALTAGLSLVVLFLFIIFYHRIFAVTFDETFARATGMNAGLYNILIALLTALVDRFSGHDRHAPVPDFPVCHSARGLYFSGLPAGRDHHFLSVRDAYRRQHCALQYRGIPGLQPDRPGQGQELISKKDLCHSSCGSGKGLFYVNEIRSPGGQRSCRITR